MGRIDQRRGILWAALAGFALAGGAGQCSFAETPAPDATPGQPRPVVSVTVQALPPSAGAIYYGQVAARVVTELGFSQGGELAERPVSEGDLVAEGAVLATLDPTDLEARLRAAAAAADAAAAQLRQARDAEDRLRALVDRGSASAVQLESATLARAAAEAAVGQAAAALVSAQDLRDSATLLAPEAGVILAVRAEPGSNLSPGQPVLQLAGLSGREVLIDLTEAELNRLPGGARFSVALDANPQIGAEAELVSVDPVAERATRTRRLHLGLVNPPEAFRIGALARVSLQEGTALPPVILLPASAVRSEGGQDFVWRVARPSGAVVRVAVKAAPDAGGRVQILSGLADGDEVLVKGIHSVAEGDVVGPQVSP